MAIFWGWAKLANLDRFVDAQRDTYQRALAEVKAGRKTTHWLWFIFPQLQGLGRSPTSIHYAIADLGEARDYLAHPLLGPRLREITAAFLALGLPVQAVFDPPDDEKMGSCMTLFAQVAEENSVFHQVLAMT